MAEPAKKTPRIDRPAEIVYRRTAIATDGSPAQGVRTREIAPTITPLIIGFLLLLALIALLALLSVQKMADVSFQARDLEQQYSARLSLLLNLRLALTKLDNEARIRLQTESRRELAPPFDVRLDTAREEVSGLVQQLDRPPLLDSAPWRQFRNDLQAYVEVTSDLRAYSLEGFTKFRTVDTEANALLQESHSQQDQIFQTMQSSEAEARRSIRLWSVLALLVGAMVAAGTVWEVQRRFKQMRQSMFESRRERTFTNQLLEGMVSAIAAIDEDDRIRSANAAFFKIFPGASIGASVLEKFAPDEAMKMLEAATATRVTRATYRGRWVTHVDDEEKTFDVYSSPLAISGDRGQIVTLVDATEVAESERTLRRTESLAAVGQATTQVAHEIRNPLGSIRLGVSMLRDSVSDAEALNTIELVERGIRHLNKLVVDVTQFSRQKALERSRVDLHDSLERSIDLVSERIRDKNAVVERRFTESSIIGQWDADQLRQVFVNVIANAIDASPENAKVRITTEIVQLDADSDGQRMKFYARVVVADRGKGMDTATRERIFEPFFSTKKRGTGLGLAIVKQIVEQHGGRISVASDPGTGSRFTVDLPI
ncbi:MAG TPA: ATP-binding protein [Pyrinomonadaceae bacterium]|jgi:signal transduction histidine kinase